MPGQYQFVALIKYGLGRQPDLGRGAGAGGADVGVADVLATAALRPGLPQPMAPRHAGAAGPATLTPRQRTHTPPKRPLPWSHR